ncbi:MAG: VWA domain-containing protein [bacterium]|nr:VWA domain-containing protein [bacterium]
MSFYSATSLILLILVPVLFIANWAIERSRAKSRNVFAAPDLFRKIATVEPASRNIWRGIFTAIALALMLVALARPQGGEKVVEEEVQGIDIMLVLDVSRSMDARDLYPSRLNAIKQVVSDFIDSSYGDRIGVIAFAGEATVICPLTNDHGAVISFIDRLTTNEDIPPGTAIGNAIRLGVNRFRESETGRVMILLTDGENNKGLEPLDALQEAVDAGVRIYTVGIGTPDGAPLPEAEQPMVGSTRFRTDPDGNRVTVGLDVDTLQKIADDTGGHYFSVSNQGELKTLYSRIAHEGETEFMSRRIVRKDELAPYFLLLAALFLIMESFYTYLIPSGVKHARVNV